MIKDFDVSKLTYDPDKVEIKARKIRKAYSVTLLINEEFCNGQSAKAVAHKIRRHAKRLKLDARPLFGDNAFHIWMLSKRDVNRLNELLKYIGGKRLGKTAQNNYGR